MPIIRSQLDPQGQAFVTVALYPSQPRVQALQTAGLAPPQTAVHAGLIDTGATITIIDPSVRKTLNIVPYRIRPIRVPGQVASINTLLYKLDLFLFDPKGGGVLRVAMLSVVETPISHSGADVLIGCDVLSRCFFGYSGTTGDFMLAY